MPQIQVDFHWTDPADPGAALHRNPVVLFTGKNKQEGIDGQIVLNNIHIKEITNR